MSGSKPTKEQIEVVAKAIWDANNENDGTPFWDELPEYDDPLKSEFRMRAKAAIAAYQGTL